MIRISGLYKRYGATTALDGLDLTVAPGEIYGLLGPNGAGKSTTIGSLLGFVAPDAGGIEVAGVDVLREPLTARARIAYIPEQVQLYPRLSGLENLAYFHQLGTGPGDDADLGACLRDAGLAEAAFHRPVAGYSKGMRQKVGIAIALARRAPVMLLDEPTSGLDPAAAREFGNSLRALGERGVGILMATHDLFRAREVAHRIGILIGGRLVEELAGDALTAAHLEELYLHSVRRADPSMPP